MSFVLLTLVIAMYISFLFKRRRLYSLAAKLPGPKGFPMIGMGYKLLTLDCKKTLQFFMTITNGYKSPAKIWIGSELFVFADTPESIQIVFTSPKCVDKSSFYDTDVLKKGLVFAKKSMWEVHRKILNPAFSIGVLHGLIPIFDEKSKIFANNLTTKVGCDEFDIYHYISACSLETILKGTMELDSDIQSDPLNNYYLHAIEV